MSHEPQAPMKSCGDWSGDGRDPALWAGYAKCPEDAEEDFAGGSAAARNLHVPDPTYACDFCSELLPFL